MSRASRRAPLAHLVGGGWRSAWFGPPGSSSWRGTLQVVASARPRPRRRPVLLGVAVVAVSTSAPLIARGRRAHARHRLLAQRARACRPRRCGCSPAAASGPAGGPRSAVDRRLSRLAGRLPGRPLRHVDPEPLVHVGGLVGRPRGHPAGVGGAHRPAPRRADPAAAPGSASASRWPARWCSPAWTCRSRAEALFGDLLALVGGMLAAAYVTVGAEVRRHVSTAVLRARLLRDRGGAAPRRCASATRPGAHRLRPGHLAGHRRARARRPAARPHAGEPRAAQHQPHGRVGGDPVRDPRRHAHRPHRVRRDARRSGAWPAGAAHRRRGGRRRPVRPRCRPTSSTPEECSRDPAPLRAGARPARRLVGRHHRRRPRGAGRASSTSTPTTSPRARPARCSARSTAPPAGPSTSTATACPTWSLDGLVPAHGPLRPGRRRALDAGRPGRAARGVGPHHAVLRTLRHAHRAGAGRAGPPLPGVRPARLPAPGARR